MKEEIKINDETNAHLLIYVLLFIFLAIAILIATILKSEASLSSLFLLSILLVSFIFTILYFKNHSAYIIINKTSISYFRSTGFNKEAKEDWSFNFKENHLILIEQSTLASGSAGNMTDCINIHFIQSENQKQTKQIISRLNKSSKEKLEELISRYSLNIRITES